MPPELQKAWTCQRWKTLPRAGGLDDQPIRLMNGMNAALAIYSAMLAYNIADKAGQMNEAWMKTHRADLRIWSRVQIMRAKHARVLNETDGGSRREE